MSLWESIKSAFSRKKGQKGQKGQKGKKGGR